MLTITKRIMITIIHDEINKTKIVISEIKIS